MPAIPSELTNVSLHVSFTWTNKYFMDVNQQIFHGQTDVTYMYYWMYIITKKNVLFPEMYQALYFEREHLYDNKITYIHISNGFNKLYFSCMYTTFKEGCFDWHWCHRPFLLFFCITFCAMFRYSTIMYFFPNYSNSVEHIPFFNPLDIAKIKLWRIIQRKRRLFTFIKLCLDPL